MEAKNPKEFIEKEVEEILSGVNRTCNDDDLYRIVFSRVRKYTGKKCIEIFKNDILKRQTSIDEIIRYFIVFSLLDKIKEKSKNDFGGGSTVADKSLQSKKAFKSPISAAHLMVSALGASPDKVSRRSLIRALYNATESLTKQGEDVLVSFKNIPDIGLFSEDLETELNSRLANGLIEEKIEKKKANILIPLRYRKYFERTAKKLDKRIKINTFSKMKQFLM